MRMHNGPVPAPPLVRAFRQIFSTLRGIDLKYIYGFQSLHRGFIFWPPKGASPGGVPMDANVVGRGPMVAAMRDAR